MRTWIRAAVVATSAAVMMGLTTATPANAAGSCLGNLKKRIAGVGEVRYSVCTKTGSEGQPLRKVEGKLSDTVSDSTKIKLRVTLYYQPTQTGQWSWTTGGGVSSKTFETEWRVANEQVVSLSKA